MKIDDEEMLIKNITSSLIVVERGYNNTVATGHDSGDTVEISNSDWIESELIPTTSINNINSFKLKFATNTDDDKAVPKGFAINDISVLYRIKRVK